MILDSNNKAQNHRDQDGSEAVMLVSVMVY